MIRVGRLEMTPMQATIFLALSAATIFVVWQAATGQLDLFKDYTPPLAGSGGDSGMPDPDDEGDPEDKRPYEPVGEKKPEIRRYWID